jgi:hypothetical protein
MPLIQRCQSRRIRGEKTVSKNLTYVDMDGHELSLVHLDPEELNLARKLIRKATKSPDWCDFDSFWSKAVQQFYSDRGVPGVVIIQTTVYQIAADLSSRLGIASGFVRPDDYLGDLEQIIRDRFNDTNRAFCKATGLSEDMLSHVLAGRKDFSMQSLAQALDRIGYALRIQRKPATILPAANKTGTKSTANARAARKTHKKVG